MASLKAQSALIAGVCVASLVAGGAAWGQAKDRPALLQRLVACRAIADAQARLACFDAASAAFEQAETKGDVVVVDREQANRVRRQAFGLALPSLNLFDRGETSKAMDEVTAKVKSAYRNGDGRWVLELEDGATWMQTDQEPVPRQPRNGSQVRIKKAALGSFMMNIDGQRAVRAKRVQ